MGKEFSVRIRTTCLVCGSPVTGRYRTYCSAACRTKHLNRVSYIRDNKKTYQREMMAKKREVDGRDKIKCIICGRSYVQIGSHTFLSHGITAREYKKMTGHDVKKGLIPEEYRKIKSQRNHDSFDIIKPNLLKGKKYWYKKGQTGVGVYERSPQTLERLKILNKLKKQHG